MAASEIDRDHIREQMRLRETDELLEILSRHDTEEWRPEVFPLVREVLDERGVDVDDELGRLKAAARSRPACELVTAALLTESSEAHAVRAALDRAGLASLEIREESAEAGGWQLLVHAEELDTAKEIVAEVRESPAAEEDVEAEVAEVLIACARCGATDITSTEPASAASALEQLFGTPAAKCSAAHRCRECDYGWIE